MESGAQIKKAETYEDTKSTQNFGLRKRQRTERVASRHTKREREEMSTLAYKRLKWLCLKWFFLHRLQSLFLGGFGKHMIFDHFGNGLFRNGYPMYRLT